jgi:hypothetical protein
MDTTDTAQTPFITNEKAIEMANTISKNTEKIIDDISVKYKTNTDAVVLPFVNFYLAKFILPETQTALSELIKKSFKVRIVDTTAIIEPSLSFCITEHYTTIESKVWANDNYYKLAVSHLDSEIKRLSNNTFCLEHVRNEKRLCINFQGAKGKIKFFS